MPNLTFICKYCNGLVTKKIKPKNLDKNKFCSIDCYKVFRKENEKAIKSWEFKANCSNCGVEIIRNKYYLAENFFCDKSCQMFYLQKDQGLAVKNKDLTIQERKAYRKIRKSIWYHAQRYNKDLNYGFCHYLTNRLKKG